MSREGLLLNKLKGFYEKPDNIRILNDIITKSVKKNNVSAFITDNHYYFITDEDALKKFLKQNPNSHEEFRQKHYSNYLHHETRFGDL